MKHITLGSASVPAIGLGTYKILGQEAVALIRKAIHLGYRHIDTAQLYDNESDVGTAIASSGIPRDEIFLTTKVWPSNLGEQRFLPSVEQSLKKLKTDYADLLLIHWPHHQFKIEDYVIRLMKIQEQGLAKNIGVSNFNISQIKAAQKTGANIVTNQVEYHPWINQTKLHLWMHQHQMPLTAYCPLGQGRFMSDKKLLDLAAKYLHSPAQIILRWMMQQDDVLAIPKTTNPERLIENINIFNFELTPDEMQMINAWRLEHQRIVTAQAGAKFD